MSTRLFYRACSAVVATAVIAMFSSGAAYAQAVGSDPVVTQAVERSQEFQQVLEANPDVAPSTQMVKTYQVDNVAVAVHSLQNRDRSKTVVVNHFINLDNNSVKKGMQVTVQTAPDQPVPGWSLTPSEKVAKIEVSNPGTATFTGYVSDRGKLIGSNAESMGVAEKVETNADRCSECGLRNFDQAEFGKSVSSGTDDAQPFGICTDAMNALCAASGAGTCFFVCAGFGTTPAGLGCGVLCGLIATYGCGNVTDFVCK